MLIPARIVFAENIVTDLYQNKQFGDATYFAESDMGNCQISPTLPQWGNQLTYHAALNNTQYISGNQSAGCGICVKGSFLGTGSGTTAPAQQFTALIVDRCPECDEGDLDLALNGGDGRWDISWQAIDCPVGNTKLAYLFEGSNPFYMKLGVRNHKIAVKSLLVQTRKSEPFVEATRKQDNFFTCKNCKYPMQFPMAIKVVAFNGQVLDDAIPNLVNKQLIQGLNNVQFNGFEDLIFYNNFDIIEIP